MSTDPQAAEEVQVFLAALARRFPTVNAALAEIAYLRAVLTLPKGTVHVVSDVHGDDKKLRHIINNASGSLRPMVDAVLGERLSPDERLRVLKLLYYPQEAYAHLLGTDFRSAEPARRRTLVTWALVQMAELIRHLARRSSSRALEKVLPDDLRSVFLELIAAQELARAASYVEALVRPFVEGGADEVLLRAAARVVRNLSISELIVAGDLGDRGPRIDRVIAYLMRQPNTRFTWGNHDFSWMGACLGQPACIATVLRISLRYRRLSQLEEGYGITLAPVEKLARTVYGDDPAERFAVKGEGLRDPLLMARMQKAMAVLQFKLESQLVRAHPEWGLAHRSLLSAIDPRAGTVRLDGSEHLLLDTRFPTIDWSRPDALSPDEEACLERVRRSFLSSQVLWEQMSYVAERGRLFLRRDDTVIFHGCVPVDEAGAFLSLQVDGQPRAGRPLFEALQRVVVRAFREHRSEDLDWLWYLWSGPLSPSFGKDKMATFESALVADPATHRETKNPYFSLLHREDFARRVLAEFGVQSKEGLIVNGHVPVKLEKGEKPLKDSGLAVTIDGAFSEAYGDKGYTLVLDAERTFLAQHHHFESIEDAIEQGADIIPGIEEIRRFSSPRTVGDTEKGDELRAEVRALERLVDAYRDNILPEARR